MKKITKIFTLLLAFAIVSTSCKKDEEPAPSLVGKWNATTGIYAKYENGIKISADTTIFNANNKLSIEFTQGGSAILTQTEEGEIAVNNFTYKTTGNKLMLYTENDTIDNNTFTLTDKQFVLKELSESEFEGNKISKENTVTFTR